MIVSKNYLPNASPSSKVSGSEALNVSGSARAKTPANSPAAPNTT